MLPMFTSPPACIPIESLETVYLLAPRVSLLDDKRRGQDRG